MKVSPRRAQRIYAVQLLTSLLADLDRDLDRERARNRPCPMCAEVDAISTREPSLDAA